jgi:hypothetical protein
VSLRIKAELPLLVLGGREGGRGVRRWNWVSEAREGRGRWREIIRLVALWHYQSSEGDLITMLG